MIHSFLTQSMRRAVTLVEVIFAVGVVLIGLLGLMSVLPLAGRRATDAISLNTSAALAESVFDDMMARRFLSNGRLLKMSDIATPLDTSSLTTSDSYVLDPMFPSVYEQTEGRITSAFTATGNGYSQTLFPYYETTHNPNQDPLSSGSRTLAAQPRLDRVGIANPDTMTNELAFINAEQALALVESPDDLPVFRPKDRTLSSTFTALQGVNSGLVYGKRVPRGVYSWIATVNPFPTGGYASVSVAILKSRQRSFLVPGTTTGTDDPNDNAVSERVASIVSSSGFDGGAGGVVHLRSSSKTVSQLRSDDWIMLSGTAGSDEIHRWFRVVGVDGKAQEINDGGTIVWEHRVLLDGPDWSFASAPNTYATLVEGVVSVTERTVLLSDL